MSIGLTPSLSLISQCPRHDLCPGIDIFGGVGHNGHLARRPAGGVDAHNLVKGHGQKAKGVIVAEVAFARKRQNGQIVQGADIFWADTCCAKGFTIKGHFLVDLGDLGLQAA